MDPMDDVFGTEDFKMGEMRREQPTPIDPSTFQELNFPDANRLSLSEKKYQTLDPHDYLLTGAVFDSVHKQQLTIGSAEQKPHLHSDVNSVGQFFPLGELGEGLAKSLEKEVEATEDRFLMARKPAVQIISSLQAFADGDLEKGPDPFTLITGRRHAGKSATLSHIVDYAKSNNWVTLFMPRMHDLLHKTGYMEPSLRRPGFFDQVDAAKALLQQIERGNGHLLHAIPVKTKDHEEANGRLDNISTLGELAAQYNNTEATTDYVGLLLDLLREFAYITEFPVLVAFDDYNHLYQPTGYYLDLERVQPEKLTIVNALRYFEPVSDKLRRFAPTYPLQNGVVIAAEGHHRVLPNKYKPAYNQVWKQVRGAATRVHVPYYSVDEVESCLRHYYSQRLSFQPPTPMSAKTMHLLTNGLPSEILMRTANRSHYHVHVHLPGGQPGQRRNQWSQGR